ncbi:hypothetical protein L207DRAFT_577680 [Hyaloscypha variabilis F]|uniref:Uncharacterized protein n=1 Tax=Hyaloscypha variabilis (strain UAMH 11265 / GT02V1 / F) TaxID=1149755 RepID=A0A2J6S7V2_HYAVF|nr:hypothetical protein L207DRAFT_577680 [Hyaloscypha variabilis F]
MSSEENVRRNVIKRSSLEEADRIYPNLTQETAANGSVWSISGKPYPFFVPSTVESTLGSPIVLAIGGFATTLTTLSLSRWNGGA